MDNIGVLDPLGKNINPLNNLAYSDTYKELGKVWSKFPVYKNVRQHITDIKNNQVILITASTGSGKSALLPRILMHTMGYKGRIVMTLPKQIITKSAAIYSSRTSDVKIGEHVGYQYKGSPKSAKSDKTNMLYSTDGSIVAMLIKDPLLTAFDSILVDELHERKIQIDFILMLLKKRNKKTSFI